MFNRVLLLCLASAVMAQANIIDFTPQFETSHEDGISMKRMYFAARGIKIIYRPPARCAVRGGGDQVRFEPQDIPEAEVRIENAPSQMPQEFDEEGLKTYRVVAESLLPKDAGNAVPHPEKRDAIPINDWRAFEKAFTYTQAGRKFTRAILFIKLDAKREIRVITTCREADYEKFYPRVFASLNTWFEIES